MNVKVQKRKNNIYGLILGYKNEEGKITSKSLKKSSNNLQEIENYRYRINSKIEAGKLTTVDEVMAFTENMFKEDRKSVV